MDVHISDLSGNRNGGNTDNKQSYQSTVLERNLNEETSRDGPNTDRNDSFPAQPAGDSSQTGAVHPAEAATRQEEANDQHTKTRITENSIEETQSLNFSFGIKTNSMNITPNSILCVMQDTNQDKYMEKAGHDQRQMVEQTRQSHQAKGKEVQPGQLLNKNARQTIKSTNQQGETSRLHQDNNRVQMDYQNNFPRISNNYARYDPNLLRNKKGETQVQDNGKAEINISSQA
ncbi:hypothetical protein R3W88_026822 [Solanum pinnatisectum]|uniref:Uncharacterized protein n=1 Tax=Solanum pinnatisectum TaxID=50273 RepID=A0AAV9LF44_9SOLN|nr:hypothetical protein R3W88_026822 [Solanum pinnatisectum]